MMIESRIFILYYRRNSLHKNGKIFISSTNCNLYRGERGDVGEHGRKGEPGNAAGQIISLIAEKGDTGDIGM